MEERRPRTGSVSVRVRRSSTSAAKTFQGLTPIAGASQAPSPTDNGAPRGRRRTLTISERLQLRDATDEETAPFAQQISNEHHDEDEVELLDVLDPRISTAANLSNVASAFWPSQLKSPPVCELDDSLDDDDTASAAEQGHLPSDASPIDAHVAKLLRRQKRSKWVKETMAGAWAFVKTPVGIFFAFYMLCVVFFGAGLVLILIHAIPMSSYNRKLYVEIFSQVLTGLFCVTSLLPLPWRLRDWYYICTIWYYQRRTISKRKSLGLAPLRDPNDLPEDPQNQWVAQGGITLATPRPKTYKLPPKQPKKARTKKGAAEESAITEAQGADISKETTVEETEAEEVYEEELPVLTTRQMHRLRHAQIAYGKAQTYYLPHSTPTKHAFPIALAFGIQTLLVWNSVFQALLCAAMWGYNRFNRPAWMTGVLIPLSFLCMIVASILIWKGAEWTKRKGEVSAAVWKMLKANQEDFEKARAEAIKRKAEDDKDKKHHQQHHRQGSATNALAGSDQSHHHHPNKLHRETAHKRHRSVKSVKEDSTDDNTGQAQDVKSSSPSKGSVASGSGTASTVGNP